jgi:alpha-beta hydrolase superfamily lysophospholipase
MDDTTRMHRQGSYASGDGLEIYYQSWHPETQAIAALVISHGLGEHSGRYADLARFLAQREIAVFACDFRGHGRSTGQRGYIRQWSDFRQDLYQLIQIMRLEMPGLPLFLFGHSLGSLITLDYVLDSPQDFHGMILSGVAVAETAISATRKLLVKILSSTWPSFATTTGLDPNGISSQAEEVGIYLSDPLNHNKGTPRLGSETFRTQREVLSRVPQLSLPVLLLHGEKDPLIPPDTSRVVYEKIPHLDKQLIYYPGCLHEVHHDVLRLQEAEDIAAWITSHSKSRS